MSMVARLRGPNRPLCWRCFLQHDEEHLDEKSCCRIHGLVKDRVLGIVRVSVNILDRSVVPEPPESQEQK